MTVHICKSGLVGLALVALFGCTDVSGSQQSGRGFQTDYDAARGALEAGKYQRANRLYQGLLDTSGPLEPRLRLEYAHSLLRSDNYGDASQNARFVAQTQSGKLRSAALSVLGVAEHELGLMAANAGNTSSAKLHFETAHNAFSEVLQNDPDLDPLGALAGRQASLQVRLRAL